MRTLSLFARRLLYSFLALVCFALAVAMAGCGPGEGLPGTELPAGPVACPPGEMPLEGGGCQPAGLPPGVTAGLPPDMPCPPGEMLLEGGGCQPAGVPPDGCGEGFVHDGQGGCNAILPPDPCPPGQMAIPGETQCREVAPCGTGDYGLIPIEGSTVFVNPAYPGNDSDGTLAKPWKKIQHGINQANPGAIVAVAAGTYTEDLLIQSKRVRLWGRCPAMVQVVGTGAQLGALRIQSVQASQSEVHSLAITGPSMGIVVFISTGVVVDQVWIHHTDARGINVESLANVTTSASLIEETTEYGVFVGGSDATVEGTIVRATKPLSGGIWGRGVNVQPSTQKRSTLVLRTSLLEQNHQGGLAVLGSDASIESTVVRATKPLSDGTLGYGIVVQISPSTLEPSTLLLRASLLEQNHDVGVFVGSSDATIETTVVRTTQPRSDGTWGRGIHIQDIPMYGPSTLTLRTSLVEQNHEAGVGVSGSDATIEATLVRATQPYSDGKWGQGVDVQSNTDTQERSTLLLRSSLLEQNHEAGLYIVGSDAAVEATVVRATQPHSNGTGGHGIVLWYDFTTHQRSTLLLRTSLLEQNHQFGLGLQGADATVEASVVRATQPRSDGTFGRGITVEPDAATDTRSTLLLRTSLLEQNHESGLVVSGSDATIEASVVRTTQPLRDGTLGRGISVQYQPDTQQRSTLLLRTSLLEQNHEGGLVVLGADATIEASVVRATQPRSDGIFGRGITVEDHPDTQERSTLLLRTSLLEQNHEVGLLVSGSDATIEGTVVRATQPRGDGAAGDGIAVDRRVVDSSPTVAITSSQIESNARAGISNFSSKVILTSSLVQCNPINLDGENTVKGQPFTFDGSKDNLCGCADKPDPTCPVRSANLSPPDPISPIDPSP